MKDNIILSEKHGVNPSISVCFLCGKEKGIALFGKLPGDKEAPKQCVVDFELCDDCKEKLGNGILILSATDTDNGNVQIQSGCYLTGKFFMLHEESFDDFFAMLNVDEKFREDAIRTQRLLMDHNVFEMIFKEEE